jgi:Rod binding domain-containing protein
MSDAVSTTTAKSYLDFSGLGELRGKAQRKDDQALRETAQQFEALFIQMMLKSMREANNVMKSDLVQSDAMETFEGMYDKEMSVQMSKRNTLGFADSLVRQVKQMQPLPSTADMLKLNAPQGMPLNPAQIPMQLQRGAKPIPLVQTELKPLNPHAKLRGDL